MAGPHHEGYEYIRGLKSVRQGTILQTDRTVRAPTVLRRPVIVIAMASTDRLEAFLAEPRNVIVAGIRKDGRPHLSPNWFQWDGERFYVSTTRHRVKYAIFRRDPRAQLAIDDSTGFRSVLVSAVVEIREDIATELSHFRAIREKHGVEVPDDEEHLKRLTEEGRVLLAIAPDGPSSTWTVWGLD